MHEFYNQDYADQALHDEKYCFLQEVKDVLLANCCDPGEDSSIYAT